MANPAFGEDAVLGDPVDRLVVGFLGVGLEHEAFARTPAPRVHQRVVAHREFVLVVVRVAVRPQIDVALRATQARKNLRRSSGSGLPVIIVAIMKVVSMILRNPSCSAK